MLVWITFLFCISSLLVCYAHVLSCRHIWKYTPYTNLNVYTCTCRACPNCGHVINVQAQGVVQCTSIVGAVASAAVSIVMVVTLTSLTPRLSSHTKLFKSGLRSASQRESGDHTTPSILVQPLHCVQYTCVWACKHVPAYNSCVAIILCCMYIVNLMNPEEAGHVREVA